MSSETQQPARPSIIGTESGPEPPYPIKMFGVVERGFGRGSKELGIPTANLPRSSIAPLEQLSSTGIYFGFARLHPIPSSSSSSSTTNQAPNPDSISNSTPEAIPKNGSSSDRSKGLSVQAIESLPGKTAAYPRSQVEGQENDRPSTISSDKTGASAAAAAVNGSGNGNGNDEGEQPALGEEDYKVWPMVMSVGYNPYYGNKEMTAEVHIMHQFPTSFYAHPLSVVLLGYVRPELNYVSKEKLIEDINEDVRVALRSLGRKEWAKWADARELEVPRDGEVKESKGDDEVEEVSKGVEGLRVGKEEKQEEIEIKLEFGGGLHLLFSSKPKHTVKLPKTTEDAPVTIRYLIKWMKDNLLSERVEMFGDGEGVRPGILVLVNDTDWELEGELDYRLEDGDEVVFISTLHGG